MRAPTGIEDPSARSPAAVAAATVDLEAHVVAHWLRDLPPGRITDLVVGEARFTQQLLDAGHPVVTVLAGPGVRDRHQGPADPCGSPIRAEVGALPLRSGSVSAALAVRVVPAVPDPGPLLREVRRILVPGGSLLISYLPVPSLGTAAVDLGDFLQHGDRHRLTIDRRPRVSAGGAPLWRDRRSGFEGQVRRAGFQVYDRIGTGLEGMPGFRRVPPIAWRRLSHAAGRLPGAPQVFLLCRCGPGSGEGRLPGPA